MFYANAARAWSVYYLYDDGDKPEGWGGNDRSGFSEAMLQAIDYQTGKVRWSHKWPGGGGRRTVGIAEHCREAAVRGRSERELRGPRSGHRRAAVARRAAYGVSNGPITYELDGVQYLVVGAGDTLYGFAMRAR